MLAGKDEDVDVLGEEARGGELAIHENVKAYSMLEKIVGKYVWINGPDNTSLSRTSEKNDQPYEHQSEPSHQGLQRAFPWKLYHNVESARITSKSSCHLKCEPVRRTFTRVPLLLHPSVESKERH